MSLRKRIYAVILSALMVLSFATGVFAAADDGKDDDSGKHNPAVGEDGDDGETTICAVELVLAGDAEEGCSDGGEGGDGGDAAAHG